MPILTIRNEIEVELTHKCNWNCPYCAIKVHTLPDITYQQAKLKILSIKNNSYVTLSGGEPGLLKHEQLQEIIQILENKNCILFINTNGEFLKRHLNLINHFQEVIYHCSQNLDDELLYIDDNRIRYMIIVNDDNICRLDNYLTKHKNVQFDIIAATYNHLNDGPILSNKNKYMILSKYSNRMTKDSIRRMIHEKDFNSMSFI